MATTPVTAEAAQETMKTALTGAGAEADDVRVVQDAESVMVTAAVPVKVERQYQTVRLAVPKANLTKEAVDAAIAAAGLAAPTA